MTIPVPRMNARRALRCLAVLAGLAALPAQADISCRTIGWLGALSQAVGRPGSGEVDPAQIGRVLRGVGSDEVQTEISRDFQSDHARQIRDFSARIADRLRLGRSVDDDLSRAMAGRVGRIVGAMPCSVRTDRAAAGWDAASDAGPLDTALGTLFAPKTAGAWSFGLYRGVQCALLTLGLGAAGIAAFRLSEKNQRRTKRFPCRIPARVVGPMGTRVATILDVSELGCKLAIDESVEIGAPIHIDALGIGIDARVIWCANGAIGGEFDGPIGRAGLAELLDAGTAQNRRERRIRRQTKASTFGRS